MVKAFFGKPRVHVFLIILFGILAYSNTFDVPFQFDDKPNIVENPLVKDLGYYASPSKAVNVWRDRYLEFRSRIVGYMTFALNYSVHGLDVTGYHVFNLLVHLLNAILVYALVIAAFRTPFFENFTEQARARFVAFFSGLLFVSHPVGTEAVTYIVQRFTSLAVLFYLAAFLAYIKFRLSEKGPRRMAFYVLTLALGLLSLKTKEFAVTLPITIALFELCFFRGSPGKRILYLVPLVLMLVTVPLSYMERGTSLAEVSKVHTSISRLDYLFTQFTVIVMYLRLLVFPANQNLDYDYPLYGSFFNPAVLVSFLFLLSLAAVGVLLFIRSRHKAREMRLVAFGIFWFFITMVPESGMIPIVDVVFEHRVYLPSVGAFIAIVTFSYTIASTSNRMPLLGKALTILLVLVSTILCAATYKRNIVWADSVRLWEDTVSKSPMKARPYVILGIAYGSAGRYDEAIKEFEKALSLSPDYAFAHDNMGLALYKLGKYGEAREHFETAIKLDPEFANAHINLGSVCLYENRIEEAIAQIREALRLDPGLAIAHYVMGLAYASKRMADMAVPFFRAALKLDPDMPEAHYNIGLAYLQKGREREAVEEFEAELRINPGHPWARKFVNEVIYEPYKR